MDQSEAAGSPEDHSLLQYKAVTMRSRSRRPQPPASGPRISGVQESEGPTSPENKRLESGRVVVVVEGGDLHLKHSPTFLALSHAHAGADVTGWCLGVVGATVGFCLTGSEERKESGGFRRFPLVPPGGRGPRSHLRKAGSAARS